MVVGAQDVPVGLIRGQKLPVLVQQCLALFGVGKHRRDLPGLLRERRAAGTRQAGQQSAALPVCEVTAEVPEPFGEQLTLRRGGALQLPAASVLPGVQQPGDAFGGGAPCD